MNPFSFFSSSFSSFFFSCMSILGGLNSSPISRLKMVITFFFFFFNNYNGSTNNGHKKDLERSRKRYPRTISEDTSIAVLEEVICHLQRIS